MKQRIFKKIYIIYNQVGASNNIIENDIHHEISSFIKKYEEI
jgi:hypothetical protein